MQRKLTESDGSQLYSRSHPKRSEYQTDREFRQKERLHPDRRANHNTSTATHNPRQLAFDTPRSCQDVRSV